MSESMYIIIKCVATIVITVMCTWVIPAIKQFIHEKSEAIFTQDQITITKKLIECAAQIYLDDHKYNEAKSNFVVNSIIEWGRSRGRELDRNQVEALMEGIYLEWKKANNQ